MAAVLWVTAFAHGAAAQQAQQRDAARENPHGSHAATVGSFLGGAAAALTAHEGSHVLFDLAFHADPGLKRVDYEGIPFFAITHQQVSRRREFVISSAGFWTQNAIDEWLLTTRRDLRREGGPFVKGMFAFNVLASAAYAGAALTRTGPLERDTRGMALSAGRGGIDERWAGTLVLAPAALDAYRYFKPEARWARWASRAVKVGMVLLAVR